jgi:hypothetical protein
VTDQNLLPNKTKNSQVGLTWIVLKEWFNTDQENKTKSVGETAQSMCVTTETRKQDLWWRPQEEKIGLMSTKKDKGSTVMEDVQHFQAGFPSGYFRGNNKNHWRICGTGVWSWDENVGALWKGSKFCLKWSKDYDLYIKQKTKYYDEKAKFAIILSCCNEPMQKNVEGHPKFAHLAALL